MSVFKKIMVSMMARFDREIVRKSAQRSMVNFLRHAKKNGLAPHTVIDIGVAYGTKPLYEAFPQSRHFLIEPIAEWEEGLQQICQKYQGEYLIAAAGASAGTVEINVHNKLSSSSILFETDGRNADGKSRVVEVVRVDEQIRLRKLQGPYLLKIDVQGFELDVLSGCTAILDECEMIILEASLFRFYKDGPEFHDVIVRLNELGYVLYDMFDWHDRPLDNALAQVDLAFVREGGKFRQMHNYATEAQRKWELEAQGTMLR